MQFTHEIQHTNLVEYLHILCVISIVGCIPSIFEIAFFSISLAVREQSSEMGSIADPLIEDES